MIRSIGWQAAGAAFNTAVGFALLVFLGRAMAPDAFAAYVALLSAGAVAVIVIAGGNANWLYRESVGASRDALRPGLGRVVAQACVATALLAALGLVLAGAPALLAMLCAGALAVADMVSVQLRAQGRFAREAAWQAAQRIASAVSILAAVRWVAPDASAVFAAWLVAVALLLVAVGRPWVAAPRFAGLGAHSAMVAPILMVDVLLVLAMKGDMAVLSARIASRDLADYAVCSRFIEAALLAFAPVANVQLRYLGLRRERRTEFDRTWQSAAAAGVAIGALALVASFVAGQDVVAWVFGEDYLTSGRLLPWLALGLPFQLANLVLAPALIARGEEHMLARWLGLGVCGWGLGLLIGSGAGPEGAALGAALGHATIAAALAWRLCRP